MPTPKLRILVDTIISRARKQVFNSFTYRPCAPHLHHRLPHRDFPLRLVTGHAPSHPFWCSPFPRFLGVKISSRGHSAAVNPHLSNLSCFTLSASCI
ncbi:hypothetical protein K469DRAFT_125895 [Zopfia rhizophila CBS 207.26]|uniref:Uncharacterized protein n=1 Tax=Zopfia rhizophila CBS 207.26 TaxID=1314779 RepID=A0A6A6D680_9PEZI|nr:hypothetical protein K469DRAFT_125895 [Zopfia rhizophila CBS 207.26]